MLSRGLLPVMGKSSGDNYYVYHILVAAWLCGDYIVYTLLWPPIGVAQAIIIIIYYAIRQPSITIKHTDIYNAT